MNLFRNLWQGLILGSAMGLFMCSAALAEDAPAAAEAQAQTSPNASAVPAADSDNDWHVTANTYLWFAGMHGTVGVDGYEASVHASAGEVFSRFNIGFMEMMEARHKRFVVPIDIMWVKLSDDKGIPDVPDYTVKAKLTQTIFTPKIGYAVEDHERLKVDATVGIRYWHLGTTLELQPQVEGYSHYQAANWVDVVAGAKITAPLSPKAYVTIAGDAGGGGANLDYQIAGFLSYKIKPKWQLFGGWRYLDVDYEGSSGVVNDTAQSGVVLGVTYVFK
jgi:hypothetical protein